jgi:hypothetical protein
MKREDITPEQIKEQVCRIQEIIFEFTKALSKLRREQQTFMKTLNMN